MKVFSLTTGQSSIWIAQSLEPDSAAYNMGECIELSGGIDLEILELAIRRSVSEAPSLRLAFVETDSGPQQYFVEESAWALPILDFSETQDPASAASEWMRNDISVPLDLRAGQPFRFALLQLSNETTWLYAVNHHLVNDGFGWRILLSRIASHYRLIKSGIDSPHRCFGSMLDIADAETSYRSGPQFARDREHWLSSLRDRSKLSMAPPGAQASNSVELATGFIAHSVDLDCMGRRLGANAAAVFVAAVAAYLFRQTEVANLVIGLQVSARLGSGMRDAVGVLTNIVPLSINVNPDGAFAQLVGVVASKIKAALRHQQYRAEDIARDLQIHPQDPDLFNVVVNFIPLDESDNFNDCRICRKPLGNWRTPDFQIAYYGGTYRQGRRFDIIANAGKYGATLPKLHSARFANLIERCAADAETLCRELPRMPDEELRQVTLGFNATEKIEDGEPFVHHRIARIARETPDWTAIRFEDEEVRYGCLNVEADALAQLLLQNGVRPDSLVAVCMDRSVEMVLAILATLKAGAAYVPLDPEQPPSRNSLMLKDTAASCVLVTSHTSSRIPQSDAKVLVIERAMLQSLATEQANIEPIVPQLTPSNLAYVIYTSGSTGVPKGVMIEHRALFNRLKWMQAEYLLDPNDRVLQKTPYTFDVSVWEFLWPLMVGATLVVSSPRDHLDARRLALTIMRNRVTTLHFVPSMLRSFLTERGSVDCSSLTRIVCSGEELSAALADECLTIFPHARLYNLYGPTEAAIDVTHWTCAHNANDRRIPIGRPIDNIKIYILNASQEPVPVGQIGQLYLAGVGLARGYLNRPDLTAELFVPNPFSDEPGARMYKTGDLGLWRADGAIEYHGRNDNQVKLRGVRIELGEIETQLRLLTNVLDAAVVVDAIGPNEQRLVAFVVEERDFRADGQKSFDVVLRQALSRQLPQQMIPGAFVRMAALPLTPNGKLDRRALISLAHDAGAKGFNRTIPTLSPIESTLYDIWQELLGRDDFGLDDDFFDLGGHSLMATRMRTRIRSRFGVDAPLKSIFETRTLRDIAKAIALLQAARNELPQTEIERLQDRDTYVLSHSQQRMWLNQSLDPESTAYNLVGAVRLTGQLNVSALGRAFNELVRRHESLRTVFIDTVEGVRQQVRPHHPDPFEAIDLRSLGSEAAPEALRLAEKDARTPFDLRSGPVMRIRLWRVADGEYILYLALHHISGDQWSFSVISREISELYEAFCNQAPSPLAPLPIQYRDYAAWQQSDPEVMRGRAELEYWLKKLDGVATLDLPTDYARPRLRTSKGASLSVPFPKALRERLEQMARQEGATLFMTMVAAFVLHAGRLAGQTDIAVGVPIANRVNREVEGLVGTFVNTLVLRIDLAGRPTFRELLARVRDIALEAYSHQDASFDELVQLVARNRDNGRPPLAQVMFNMLNAPLFLASLKDVTWEPLIVDRAGAQFDLSLSVDAQVLEGILFEYNSDLYKDSSIQRFASQYLTVLESVVADPLAPIASINLLPASEAKLLLEDWNATTEPAPHDDTFVRVFERQVRERPDAIALHFRDERISYRELDQRAERLAGHLAARGVRPGVGVGVCLERSSVLVVTLLGVQKSGGHYVPLDPAIPSNRLRYMIEDAGLSVLCAEPDMVASIGASQNIVVIDSRTLSSVPPAVTDRRAASPEDLAYIIYTSGSTGRPKGVRVTQRGLINLLRAMKRRPGLTEHDALVAVTTVSFDISGLELYLPLSAGARVILAPDEVCGDGELLADLLNESGATVLQATPSGWRMLLDAGWSGSRALRGFCGGEALAADLARELLPRLAQLWNLYGPTETTIWSTAWRVVPNRAISIGTPIDNTRVYVVDSEGQICPIGVTGEIWIAGDGVAEGYQNKPELTATRFQPDPFASEPGCRLYRTGDLGAWGSDGCLYHFGRSDTQLKVRGFRIEAEEVEALLRSHPDIRDAVVAVRSAGGGDVRLVGYLIAREGRFPTSSELRAHIRESAPDYMAPSIFVELDSFPMTSNGKLDRNAFPDPFGKRSVGEAAFEPPAPGLEQATADIWKQVLKLDIVGANDNFFELGGHSLLALRVAALVRSATGKRLDPRRLYFQTLRQTAADLDDAESSASGP